MIEVTAKSRIANLFKRIDDRLQSQSEIDLLIVGGGSQLSYFISSVLLDIGIPFDVVSLSENRISHDQLRPISKNGLVLWISGYSRPSDKYISTSDYLTYISDYYKKLFGLYGDSFRDSHCVHFGSSLQLSSKHFSLPYVQSKTDVSLFLEGRMSSVSNSYLPNNEGLLRSYDHWLQTFLYRACFPEEVTADSPYLSVNISRRFYITETRELASIIIPDVLARCREDFIYMPGESVSLERLLIDGGEGSFVERLLALRCEAMRPECVMSVCGTDDVPMDHLATSINDTSRIREATMRITPTLTLAKLRHQFNDRRIHGRDGRYAM